MPQSSARGAQGIACSVGHNHTGQKGIFSSPGNLAVEREVQGALFKARGACKGDEKKGL